jgi:hypothetical protein
MLSGILMNLTEGHEEAYTNCWPCRAFHTVSTSYNNDMTFNIIPGVPGGGVSLIGIVRC